MVAKQFSYMLEYVSAEQRKALEHCVALSLVRQQRDNQSGLVTLVFNIVYAPYIQMRYVEYLQYTTNFHCQAQLELVDHSFCFFPIAAIPNQSAVLTRSLAHFFSRTMCICLPAHFRC